MEMHMHILPVLCALTRALSTADEFDPRVAELIVGGLPQGSNSSWLQSSAYFTDLDTLIFNFRSYLQVSFNDSESWKAINLFNEIHHHHLDLFQEEGTFVYRNSRKIQDIYVSEDQGKRSKKSSLPRDLRCFPVTHALDGGLLMFDCAVIDGDRPGKSSFRRHILYSPGDADESFRNLPEFSEYSTKGKFATCSKDPSMKDDQIYYMHPKERSGSKAFQVHSLNPSITVFGRKHFEEKHQSFGDLFHARDLSKTTRIFGLNDILIKRIFTLPQMVRTAVSDISDNNAQSLWPSKKTTFKNIDLFKRVTIGNAKVFSENDDTRLSVKNNDRKAMRRATTYASSHNFSWNPRVHITDENMEQVGNLKETSWEKFELYEFLKKKLSSLRRVPSLLKDSFSKEADQEISQQVISVTKGFFENGTVWSTLNLVDPSGKHSRLFKDDVYDLEYLQSPQARISSWNNRRKRQWRRRL